MDMKTKSALSYFGSDSEVAESLAERLSSCSHVTIPFVGGASIIPHLKARALVCNDLNRLAITFYRAVCGPDKDELVSLCERTLSHPDEIETAKIVISQSIRDVEIAWAYWALCWLGRKGKGGTRGVVKKPSVRYSPNGGTNATRIKAAAEDLESWANHFKRCEWTSEDFRVVLEKVHDNPECGIYLDAPWWGAGSAYLHSFSVQDHVDLRDYLKRFSKAKIVVRYDDCPAIRDLYKEFEIVAASSKNQAGGKSKELCIVRRENG